MSSQGKEKSLKQRIIDFFRPKPHVWDRKLRFSQYEMYDEATDTVYWCPVENPTRPPFPSELKLRGLVK